MEQEFKLLFDSLELNSSTKLQPRDFLIPYEENLKIQDIIQTVLKLQEEINITTTLAEKQRINCRYNSLINIMMNIGPKYGH